MLHNVKFKNQKGQTLIGIVHEPKKYDTAVVVCHGFPSNMTGTSNRVCRGLTAQGYLCLRFDFSGSGKSEGRFEDKLMSQETKEIKYAIDHLQKNYKFSKLALLGGSTGAIDVALYAHKDKRISKLILSGMVYKLDEAVRYDFTDKMVHDFWTKGYIKYNKPGKWYHNKKLRKAFYDEFFKRDTLAAVKKYHGPLLIIHGGKDQAVPLENAKKLFKAANKPKKLAVIPGADHNYHGREKTKRMIEVLAGFIA